jgi:hypothetical protein
MTETELINFVYRYFASERKTAFTDAALELLLVALAGANSISSVTVDTSALGGSGTQALYDDGTHGDLAAGV